MSLPGRLRQARKDWILRTAAGIAGMVTQQNGYTMPSVTNRFRVDTTWTAEAYGKPYVSSAAVTTYDLRYAASKRVEQVLT